MYGKQQTEDLKIPYGYQAVEGDAEAKHRGYSFKTSQALIDNVIAKKEMGLFSEMDQAVVAKKTETRYVDHYGKRVDLSAFQLKIITALAEVVDSLLNKTEVQDYIQRLPTEIDERTLLSDGTKKPLPKSVRAIVDIKKLTRLVYGRNRIGGTEVDKVRDGLIELSEIRQQYEIPVSGRGRRKGGKYVLEAPLIQFGKSLKYIDENGVQKLNVADITFEDVFVYEINDKYSLAPLTLLNLWNEAKVNTELFSMLLFLLQRVRGSYVSKAISYAEAKEKELRKEKLSKEEIAEAVERVKDATLTYSETVSSILERVSTDKYKYGENDTNKFRRGKVRTDKVKKDLAQAVEGLKQVGIIKNYYESKAVDGDIKCNFVINEKWLSDEKKRLEAIDPDLSSGTTEEAKEDAEAGV